MNVRPEIFSIQVQFKHVKAEGEAECQLDVRKVPCLEGLTSPGTPSTDLKQGKNISELLLLEDHYLKRNQRPTAGEKGDNSNYSKDQLRRLLQQPLVEQTLQSK